MESTETKIAILASLLEPATYPPEDYLQALVEADGDVAKAAEALLLPRVKSSGKRKAGTSLESWLGKKSTSSTSIQPPPRPDGPKLDLSILRDTTQTKPKPKTQPQPALVLTSQQAITAHKLPLALLKSPLSPALASALFLTMMEESEKWDRNRFYLAGKWVESPHTTAVYARAGDGYGDEDGKARYFYSGTELAKPEDYPDLLKQAADLVEVAVNESMEARRRYPWEWGGKWRANVCGANRYDGASSGVGWHADQLTYLGPYCSIASLSLGTPRAFRLRQTESTDPNFATSKPIRTYEVNLGHNSLCLMEPGCQERFKHTVPPQKALDLFRPGFDIHQKPIPSGQETYTSRINITFRFYRDDFHPIPKGIRQGTPECKCGIPTLLRADQKAKVRSKLDSPSKRKDIDDMVFFWQCQSPGLTGEMKGCGFFRILDMRAEGRGPCVGDV